jgi:two-component system, NarL family, nitrate/nitrite response regulator NarL
MSRTKVLVADPLAIFRAGVHNLLSRESEFSVVEAAELEDVQTLARTQYPDIALIDLDLPPRGGVEAVRWLGEHCRTRTIAWSFEPQQDAVLAAVLAGASGFLRKDIAPDRLVRSLRGLVAGQAALSHDIATLMINAIHGLASRERTEDRLSALSTRECEVLERVARGALNRQIASELTISEFTVKRHMQNILGKLGYRSRREAGDFYRTAQATLAGIGRMP